MEISEMLADALAAGRPLDLAGDDVPAQVLVTLLTAARPPGAPVLRLQRAHVTGALRLTGAVVTVPVELLDCTLDEVPDLRMARFDGLAMTGCRVPGVSAGNLRVDGDLLLDGGFTATGPVFLLDANIGGSLRLSGGRLLGGRLLGGRRSGDGGRALVGDRIVVEGTCYARRLHSEGEVRIPGARITGNLDLAGAELVSATGKALDATGVAVGGSLLAGRHDAGGGFTATGRVLLAGARVGGDLVFSGARIERPPGEPPEPAPPDPVEAADQAMEENAMPLVPGGIVDPAACLVADRIRVEGNLELDDGARTAGTVRLPNAVVGGYVRLSGAHLCSPYGAADRGIALLGDGMEVGGDLEGRDDGRGALVCAGQLRLVDARVRGSASLSGITLSSPGGYAIVGDRLRIGGEFYLRRLRCSGTVRLQNAEIGSSLDCTAARLEHPRRRLDGTVRPSLDVRSAIIGKDLLCTSGFVATGGVRIRRLEARKSVRIADATLGVSTMPGEPSYSLNAYGLSTPELEIRPAVPPAGPVRLVQARVGTFADSAPLYSAVDGVTLDGFDYTILNETPRTDVRTRLQWIRQVVPDYAPGPYEQLAAAYRRAGNEELALQVLIARQRRRYAELGRAGRIWGRLQDVTVGFGYRPWLAACWLVACWLLGGVWFLGNEPPPLAAGRMPAWNPWLFAADTLLPIVDFGQDGFWRLAGASQWVGSVLVAAGWVLATTAAAGAARILKRV